MNRSIVFDTGPIISLTTNNLLWVLEPLQKEFEGDFLIPLKVRAELIDRPLKIKRFKFEAMQVLSFVKKGVIKIADMPQIQTESEKIINIANRIFKAKGRWLQLVHPAEIEAVALALLMNSSALVVDERTTRMLIERPERIKKSMEKKLHTRLWTDKGNLKEFQKLTKGLNLIRSTELAAVAYKKGLLNSYVPDIANPRKQLLESVLWGLKINGCSISSKEIRRMVKIMVKK